MSDLKKRLEQALHLERDDIDSTVERWTLGIIWPLVEAELARLTASNDRWKAECERNNQGIELLNKDKARLTEERDAERVRGDDMRSEMLAAAAERDAAMKAGYATAQIVETLQETERILMRERGVLRSELAALTQPQVKADTALGLIVRGLRERIAGIKDSNDVTLVDQWDCSVFTFDLMRDLLAAIDAPKE